MLPVGAYAYVVRARDAGGNAPPPTRRESRQWRRERPAWIQSSTVFHRFGSGKRRTR